MRTSITNTPGKQISEELLLPITRYYAYRKAYYSFWLMTELIESDMVSPSERLAIMSMLQALVGNPSNFHGLNVLFSRKNYKFFQYAKMIASQVDRLNTVVPNRFVLNGQYDG